MAQVLRILIIDCFILQWLEVLGLLWYKNWAASTHYLEDCTRDRSVVSALVFVEDNGIS